MDKAVLSVIDIVLIVAYLAVVTAVALWASRGVKSSKDYFLAGKSLPWWAVALSLVVSDIGAKDMVGLATDGYRWGVVMMNFDFLGCIFAVLLAAFLFMPFFWMAGIYTVPEYLGRRYNSYVRTFFAVVWTVFMVATLGTIFVSAAAMFKVLLGWDFWLSVGIVAVAGIAYTTVGGLRAVVFTEVLSCIILIAGAALICFFGLERAGGWDAMRESVEKLWWTEHHFSLIPPADHPAFPWPAVFLGLGIVLGPAYWIGNQAIVQRDLGARSGNDARAAYVMCAAIKLVFPVLLVVPGLIALALFSDTLGAPFTGQLGQENPEWQGKLVLPRLVVELLPRGALGVVVGAFLAGITSNLDSYVNSASTLLVSDIYKPFVRPRATDRECLRLGRFLTVGLICAGVAASYVVETYYRDKSVFEAFQDALTLFQGALFALLLLGMLWSRATQWGGLAGMLCGVASAVVLMWGYDMPYLWVAWWSFVVAVTATVAVSLVTRPYDTERLRGLVCWIPMKEDAKP